MEIEIYVESSHWMDRAPSVELREIENIEELFKQGQVESPILTVHASISGLKVLRSPAQEMRRIGIATYSIKGKIVAGYEAKMVVDCGVLLRIGVEDAALRSSISLSFGDYVEFQSRILGFYHDLWEGIMHYQTKFRGRVKQVSRIEGANDISLLLEVLEPGSGIVISLPYKRESKPDPDWHYQFVKSERKTGD